MTRAIGSDIKLGSQPPRSYRYFTCFRVEFFDVEYIVIYKISKFKSYFLSGLEQL